MLTDINLHGIQQLNKLILNNNVPELSQHKK